MAAQYTEREERQVEHALAYSNQFAGAGVPGHVQFLLIAKLATELAETKEALRQAEKSLNLEIERRR